MFSALPSQIFLVFSINSVPSEKEMFQGLDPFWQTNLFKTDVVASRQLTKKIVLTAGGTLR